MDPVSLTVAAVVTALNLGAAESASDAAEAAAETSQQAATYNAAVDKANAEIVAATTISRVEQARGFARRAEGEQRAAIGSTGITADSFDDVVAEATFNAEMDINAIKLAGEVEEFNLLQRAQVQSLAGSVTAQGYNQQAQASRLSMASSVAQGFNTYFSLAGTPDGGGGGSSVNVPGGGP